MYLLRPENVVKDVEKPQEYIISVDTGISASATTFVTMGFVNNTISVHDNYYHKNGREVSGPDIKDIHQYAEDLADYFVAARDKFGFIPSMVYIDRDISFLRVATEVFDKRGLPSSLIKYAIKESIDDRIRTTSVLLYQGKLVIDNKLKTVINAFENAVYDSKALDEKGKLERLDVPHPSKDVFNPIDILDPIEYGVSHFIRRNRGLMSE